MESGRDAPRAARYLSRTGVEMTMRPCHALYIKWRPECPMVLLQRTEWEWRLPLVSTLPRPPQQLHSGLGSRSTNEEVNAVFCDQASCAYAYFATTVGLILQNHMHMTAGMYAAVVREARVGSSRQVTIP